jgi:hypothetical protein
VEALKGKSITRVAAGGGFSMFSRYIRLVSRDFVTFPDSSAIFSEMFLLG